MPRTYRRPLRSALVPALLAVLLAAMLLAGCGRDSGPDIMGQYTDSYGDTYDITQGTWTNSYPGYPSDVFHIADYNNQQLYILAQNDAANAYNAGLYSRFVWMYYGGALYYCQDVYNAATLDAARTTPLPSVSDPTASTACGGFAPWTKLIPVMPTPPTA